MKQLKLKINFATDKEVEHTIHLGQQEWLKHKSKTFLKLYLRTYKKVLLDNVIILNNYNSQIYTLYRTFFFDFNGVQTEMFSQYFNDFNKNYNWIFHSSFNLENSILFNKINQSIYCLYDVLNLMLSVAQKQKNYSLKKQVESSLKMVTDLEHKYESDRRSLNLTRDYTKTNLKLIKKELKKIV